MKEKVDHLSEIGVDAVWMSPFYKSPMNDFGYDVSDYREVDPLFGTMDDFNELIKVLHDKGKHNAPFICNQLTDISLPWAFYRQSAVI